MPGGINVPLDVILSWPSPNYNDPVTQPKRVLVFSCIIGPISIALLCARLWVRIHMQHNAGWDDWLMLAAAFPMSALTVIFPLVTEVYRFDRHAWDVEYKYFPIQRKFVMAIYVLYSLTSGLIKLSILLFYRRLSSRAVSPTFRWTMRIIMFIIGGYSVAFIIIPIFMCRPISAFWDQVDFTKFAQGQEWTCINEGADVVAHGIISTVQDLIVAFLPTILCWNLQMPLRQKIALYSIFALGYTSVAIGAMRTYQGYRLFFTTYDVTWVASDIWLWSLLELHIGSMCANAPALKIFFEKVLKVNRLTSWTPSRSRSQPYGSRKQDFSNFSATPRSTNGQIRGINRFKTLIQSGNDKSSQLKISHPRSATLRINAHVDPSPITPRDSMTKPLASEYIDTVLIDDNRENDIEMGKLPTSHFDNHVQALPQLQSPVFLGGRDGRPPPLSQI
ncbi:hypothetical protein E8E12_007053 [Didymella heteroderae]|uniref:Rhodopsin domain-containing protein n=1 Tax=Didymella heteroderae TaxID=1769908 RepID=A0A9P4X0Q2_9PLEO|nr:hypothetical protein E8E12_007053 [Didymella heteroderae]